MYSRYVVSAIKYIISTLEIALKHKIDQRMQIIKTGIVKTKQHLNEKKKLKINNEEKFDFKCLVIDRHSLKDWYDNGRSYALNWKINLDFYEDINNLAKKNQNILLIRIIANIMEIWTLKTKMFQVTKKKK